MFARWIVARMAAKDLRPTYWANIRRCCCLHTKLGAIKLLWVFIPHLQMRKSEKYQRRTVSCKVWRRNTQQMLAWLYSCTHLWAQPCQVTTHEAKKKQSGRKKDKQKKTIKKTTHKKTVVFWHVRKWQNPKNLTGQWLEKLPRNLMV